MPTTKRIEIDVDAHTEDAQEAFDNLRMSIDRARRSVGKLKLASVVAHVPLALLQALATFVAVMAALFLSGCGPSATSAPLSVQIFIVGVLMWALSVTRCPAQ
jgi:hypothetical protein